MGFWSMQGLQSNFQYYIKTALYIIYKENLVQFAREVISNNVLKDIPNLSEECLLAAIHFDYEDEVIFCIENGADRNAQLDNLYILEIRSWCIWICY